MIGICGFFRQNDRRNQHKGEVIQMYVQPNYQGKKIGQTLLQRTLDEAFKINDLKKVEMEVFTNSKAAIKIYYRAGFQDYKPQMNSFKENENYSNQKLMVIHRDQSRNTKK